MEKFTVEGGTKYLSHQDIPTSVVQTLAGKPSGIAQPQLAQFSC